MARRLLEASLPNLFSAPALCLDVGCVSPAGWEILQLACRSIHREFSAFCIVTEDRTLIVISFHPLHSYLHQDYIERVSDRLLKSLKQNNLSPSSAGCVGAVGRMIWLIA